MKTLRNLLKFVKNYYEQKQSSGSRIYNKKCMFKSIVKRIKRFFFKLKNNDPLFNCEYHKQHGCVHVDGPLCDFPNCCIRLEYVGKDFIYCQDCVYFDDCCSPKFGLGCYNGKKLVGIVDTVNIQDCNPKKQTCVLTNHGIVTDVIFK